MSRTATTAAIATILFGTTIALLEWATIRSFRLKQEYPRLKSPDYAGRSGAVYDPSVRSRASLESTESAYDDAIEKLLRRRGEWLAADEAQRPLKKAQLDEAEQAVAAFAASRPVLASRRNHDAGMLMQAGTILVLFKQDASFGRIREVFQKHKLSPRAANLDIPWFVTDTREPPTGTPAAEAIRLRAIVEKLRKEERDVVIAAVQNVFLGVTTVSGPRNPPMVGACWDFHDVNCSGTNAFRTMEFPQAWNFSEAIRSEVTVGILDNGFEFSPKHQDLQILSPLKNKPQETPVCGGDQDIHGNQMAGIIAGQFPGATRGVGGASPFAKITACAPLKSVQTNLVFPDLERNSFAANLAGLQKLLESNVRVINASIGYNWGVGIDPETSSDVRDVVSGQGEFVRQLMRAHSNAILVASAGNDSNSTVKRHAKWASPFNWAVLGPGSAVTNIIVVEARKLANENQLVDISNTGGTISAIGEGLTTTGLHNAEYNQCPASTSCATPVVTATIALMLAYNPNLSVDQIRTALGIGSGTPRLRAFAAMHASRPNADADADLADLVAATTLRSIDKADFEEFKRAFQQVRAGSFTDDLNGDGAVNANDARFARMDLNGDGTVTKDDLRVMLRVWTGSSEHRDEVRAFMNQS